MLENTSPEDDLFEEALLKTSGPERAAFLEGACRNDHELRARVEMMIDGHLHADGFLPTLPDRTPPPGGSATGSTSLEQVGSSIGPYKLLQKIGEGGCGVVYVAEQEKPVRRRVALKVIKLGMDTRSVLARFEAERQALAMMDHPNIARVLEAGATDAGRPYFVMELVKGIRITDYCDQNDLTTDARLDLFTQVCHAIQHAHQKGIIHRDIKPSNVLVTSHDGVPVPKVIDFGIAKATQERLTDLTIYTELNQFIGTPAYMSPEQAELSGLDIDTRTDIYALGVLLYELLTGTTPFDGRELLAAGLDAMRRTIREKEPARPSTRLSTMLDAERTTLAKHRQTDARKLTDLLRGDLDWIVMKCLEKDRTRRYETANGLAADLKRHLNNEPVVARPASAAYRLQKAFRRNKLVFSAATAVAVALLAGIAVSTWQATEAMRARNRATRAEAAKTQEARIAQQERDRAVRAENDAHAQTAAAKAAWAATRRAAYAAEINVAFQSLEENSLDRAREILDRQRPRAGEEDLRGFEWRYLWQLCQGDEIASFPDGPSVAAAFSPDGNVFASASDKITVRETASQRVIITLPEGAYTLAFAPNTTLLATASYSGVTLWDTATWQSVRSLPNTRFPALFSPDGRWLVTGTTEGYRLWDAKTWEALGDCPDTRLHPWHARNGVAFSRDGQFLVFAAGGTVGPLDHFRVWRLPKLEELFVLRPNASATSVAFSADGKQIVAGLHNGQIVAWDFATQKEVATLKEHTAWITSIAVAPDGKTFATTGSDRTVVLWDAATLELLVRLRGHLGEVWALAISGDGSKLLTTSSDGTTKLWNPETRHKDLVLDGLLVAGFIDAGRQLVTVTPKGWSLSTHTGIGVNFPVSANPPILIQSGTRPADVNPHEPIGALGREDGTVELYNLVSGARITAWKAHESGTRVVSFSSNGKRLATGSAKGEVKVWEAALSREIVRIGPVDWKINCLAFSPDGKLLAGSGDSSRVRLWDTTTGRDALELGYDSYDHVMSVAFSPDGRMLATTSMSANAVRLWELPSGKQLSVLKGHVQGVSQVAFSPDGKTLASGGNDQKIKLWNVATRQELLTVRESFVTSLRFSSDGVTLAFSDFPSPVGRTRVLRAPSFEEIESLEAKEKSEIKQP